MTRAAPYYDAIKDWQNTGVAPNYCMWGDYRNFIGDNSTTGATHTQIQHLEAHKGQPVEIVMCAMSLSLGNPTTIAGMVGAPQHFYLQVPLAPNNGTYLAKTIDGTNDHFWDAIVAAFATYGIDMQKCTMVLGWEFFFGSSSFQWSLGQGGNTIAQYNSAFRHVVLRMRAQGFTGTFMADWTGATLTQISTGALYPGDDVTDMIGYHIYNGTQGLSQRTDQVAWWSYRKQVLDGCSTFARNHGKLCGASEMGLTVAAAGDTTSNTYTFHTADVTWYWTLTQAYMVANCDVWAGLTLFGQDLGNPTYEFNAIYYYGTDPATQPANHLFDTNQLGTVYDTVSPRHANSSAAFVRSVMVPGSMQIATSSGGGSTGGGGGGPATNTRLLYTQT